ncbi:uncharacterized protein CEXT_121481 [Caerostris extrusa]|uniref:Uncharacterized protein n=1 Tax=Caerostris extrusa TaxID=172846 RepID=A0AAV4RI75_CAEEX|nr:uncharacterized protein CEXT_121481 [Caerostris extrusa]
MKINLNVFLYATSSITAEEFCENREVEFSRLVYETVSYSKILCDRISMMPSKENKKDLNFPNYKSNVVHKNGTLHDLARIELENSLFQSLLSSSLLQTFYLCGCNSRQLSLLAAQLSGAVFSLHKSSMLKQLSLQKKLVQNLSASNNKCEKLNIRALASTMILFIVDENTSKNNNLIFQSSNFSNDFKNAIEKAMTSNNTLPFNSVLFPQRSLSSKLVNNYCQANIVNNRDVSSEIDKSQ